MQGILKAHVTSLSIFQLPSFDIGCSAQPTERFGWDLAADPKKGKVCRADFLS